MRVDIGHLPRALQRDYTTAGQRRGSQSDHHMAMSVIAAFATTVA
jgi:hypothetical protein